MDRLDLGRLDRDAVRAQMAAIAGAEPDPRTVDRTWRRSDGNPYFVEELASAGDDHAPVTLTASLTARLAVLSPPTREIVRIVALGGRSIDEGLLVAVADRAVSEVRDALHEAVERRVLAIGDDGRIGFRHALVREVAEGELLAGERRDLHERLASVLAERTELAEPSPAGAAAELAHHWEGAGRSAEALTRGDRGRSRRGARRGLGGRGPPVRACPAAGGAGGAARGHRSDRAPAPGGGGRRAQRRPGRARRPSSTGRWPRPMVAASGSRCSTRATGTCAGRRATTRGRWRPTSAASRCSPPTRRAPRVPGSSGRRPARCSGLGRYDEGRRVATDGVATAEAAGAEPEEARARNVLGSILVALGEVEPGIAQLERSAELAAKAGPSDMRVIGPYNLAVNLAMAGRLREAQDAAARGVEAARTEGLQRRYGMDLAALEGDVLTRLGRWDDAAEVMDGGLALDPSGRGTIYLATARGRLEALRGDVATARRWFGVADDLAEGQIDADLAGYLARARAEAALVEGDASAALEICRAGLVPLEGADDHFVRSPLLVLAIQAAAEVAEAARAAHETATGAATVAPYIAELEAQRASAPMVAALRAHALAESSRLDGQSSPDRWTDASARYAEIPDPFGVAYARYRSAEASLRRDGVKADVGELLRDAADEAAGIGALPLYRSIEILARRARVPMERPAEPDRPEPEAAPAAGGLSPGRSRSSGSSPTGCRTARSARRSSSAARRPACTSRTSSTSSGWRTASRRRWRQAGSACWKTPRRASRPLRALGRLPGRELDRDAAVGVRGTDEDLVDRTLGLLELLDTAQEPAGLIGDAADVGTDRACRAVAGLAEQRGRLLAGVVVVAVLVVVDGEDEVAALVEVPSTGGLEVHVVVDEDPEDVDEAALVGHGAGAWAPRAGLGGLGADLLVHGATSWCGCATRFTPARARRSYDGRQEECRPGVGSPRAGGWRQPCVTWQHQ